MSDYDNGYSAYYHGHVLNKCDSDEFQHGWRDAKDEEEAYEEEALQYHNGYNAFYDGAEFDNKQSPGWRSGWRDAYDENNALETDYD
jgi:hypothetical protein